MSEISSRTSSSCLRRILPCLWSRMSATDLISDPRELCSIRVISSNTSATSGEAAEAVAEGGGPTGARQPVSWPASHVFGREGGLG